MGIINTYIEMKRFLYSIGLLLFFIFYRKLNYSLKNRLLIFFIVICFDHKLLKPTSIKLKDVNIESKNINNFFSKEEIKKFIDDDDIPYEKINLGVRNLSWTDKQLELKKNIINGKYDQSGKYKFPTISKDNSLIDGYHRVTTLLTVYGGEHIIKVKKIKSGDFTTLWLVILLLCIDKWYDSIEINYNLMTIVKSIVFKNNTKKNMGEDKFWVSLTSEKIEDFTKFIDLWNTEYPTYKIDYKLK